LAKEFPGTPAVVALQPCDLRIERGEMVAVTGPSGSGKSTLLSILGLLDTATAGSYRLHGVDVAGFDDDARAAVRANELGFVFQAFHLIGYRSVLENVELGLVYQAVPRKDRRRRAIEIIGQVGLAHRRDSLCANLSGGERQRAAIARALVRDPSLILCDEPTGNLDSSNSEIVLSLLEELHQTGMTIVIITHDSGVADRADRSIGLLDGHLVEKPDGGSR
jgi:putative ABC transport system ATP-binding protein